MAAMDPRLAAAKARRRVTGLIRSRQPVPGRAPPTGRVCWCDSALGGRFRAYLGGLGWLCRRRWYAGQREVAADDHKCHRDHAVRIRADPAEEANVLDQHPVREAERDHGHDGGPEQPGLPAQQCRTDRGEHDHDEQVDREPMRRDERAETGHQGRQDVRLRCLRHVPDHAGEAARLPMERALPETAARPCLQDRHPDEEQADGREDDPAKPRRRPGADRQRDQAAGDAVEQDRSWRAEQPGQPVAEHAAEGLAEDPDEQSPAHTDQPAQPRPGALRRNEQPDADAELDPDRCRRRGDRVICPRVGGPVDHVLYPPRRTRRQQAARPATGVRAASAAVSAAGRRRSRARRNRFSAPGARRAPRVRQPRELPSPAALSRLAGSHSRRLIHATSSNAKITAMRMPWWISAARNAATIVELPVCRPRSHPGHRIHCFLREHGARRPRCCWPRLCRYRKLAGSRNTVLSSAARAVRAVARRGPRYARRTIASRHPGDNGDGRAGTSGWEASWVAAIRCCRHSACSR